MKTYHPSKIEQINAKKIQKPTLTTHGRQNPQGLDVLEWTKKITHFNQTSTELWKTIAKLSYTIASEILLSKKPNSLQLVSSDTSGQQLGLNDHWFRRGYQTNIQQNNHLRYNIRP